MSLGTLRGKVKRHARLYYKAFSVQGKLIEGEAKGLLARIIQHETDHVDGVVFLDRVIDTQTLGFHAELVASGILTLNKTEDVS